MKAAGISIVVAIVVVGVLLGGITGVVLGKRPAKSRMGNAVKGALVSLGTFMALFFFALMVLRVILGDFEGNEFTHRS